MKIILSEKFKEHMVAHEHDLFLSYEELIHICEEKGCFNKLYEGFVILEINFDMDIGYCNLVKVDENDEVIYAKRSGRNIYTKFVKGKEPTITNSLVVILKRSYNNHKEYSLITAYPGNKSCKEPQDKNIRTKQELVESLKFWSDKALVYDKSIIQPNSIRTCCPYKDLYLAAS